MLSRISLKEEVFENVNHILSVVFIGCLQIIQIKSTFWKEKGKKHFTLYLDLSRKFIAMIDTFLNQMKIVKN